MRTARCPECGARVRVTSTAEIGDEITCQSCGEELEVSANEPLTLGYLGNYEEGAEEEEDELEDELEDDEDPDDDWEESDDEEDDTL